MRSTSPQATILVVDDSADTREMIQRKLTGAGYQVLCASGVAAAGVVGDR